VWTWWKIPAAQVFVAEPVERSRWSKQLMLISRVMRITAHDRSSLRARRRSGSAVVTFSCWHRVGMQPSPHSPLTRSETKVREALRPLAPQTGSRGFTLIELLVTMAVGGILLAMALPSFRAFIENSRLTAQANSLVMSLDYARSEAIKRDLAVTVCAADLNTTTCNGSATWSTGWVVQDPSGASPLQAVPATTGNVTLTAELTGPITFSPNGTASAAVSFNICDTRGGAYAQDVEVSASGRVEAAAKQGYALDGVTALVCP
jgi:type IV fimbrial biogenesis protein FimT